MRTFNKENFKGCNTCRFSKKLDTSPWDTIPGLECLNHSSVFVHKTVNMLMTCIEHEVEEQIKNN